MFDQVLLEPEQKELLSQLVEAARNVPLHSIPTQATYKARILVSLLVILVSALMITFGLSCKGSNEQPGVIPTRATASEECPGLEDRLYRMVKAADPARWAQEQKMYYQDGLVRVAIELTSPDAPLPSGYQLQIEGRVQGTVQALVPLGELCSLSREPQVRSIMVPLEFKPIGR